MYRLVSLLAAMAIMISVAACGDNQSAPADASPPRIDAPEDLERKACLDQPTELARPPGGQLPCELLPPGFSP